MTWRATRLSLRQPVRKQKARTAKSRGVRYKSGLNIVREQPFFTLTFRLSGI